MDGVEMEMFAAAIVVLSIALLSPPGTPFRPTKKHQTVTCRSRADILCYVHVTILWMLVYTGVHKCDRGGGTGGFPKQAGGLESTAAVLHGDEQ